MEPRTDRAPVTVSAPMGAILQEQGIELDHVLPDYYPDVCKLVKCTVSPTVVSESIAGDRLSYELRVEVRILYCGEDSHVLQCVTQVLHYPRTAELPAGEEITAEIVPTVDHVNCRALSRRRLDVRGAMTIRIRPTAVRRQEVLTDVSGLGLQAARTPVQYPAGQLRAVRRILLSEELELGNAKPPVLHVVRCAAQAAELTQKLVSGKLLVQGSLGLQLLYACEKDGDGSLEPMGFKLPFSQLLDIEGITEQDDCRVTCTVVSCELSPCADTAGDVRMLRCEAELRVCCTAVRMAETALVTDAFSTEHPCEVRRTTLLTSGRPSVFGETVPASAVLPCPDSEIDCVYDAWGEVRALTASAEGDEVVLSGMLWCGVLVRESGGMPRMLEREEPFEHRFPSPGADGDAAVDVCCTGVGCSYTLTGAAEVTVRAELRLEGTVTQFSRTEVVEDVTVQADEMLPRDYALLLYFGRTGEPVWDIAKRCRTTVAAIMEENDLPGDVLDADSMLLIPIVE